MQECKRLSTFRLRYSGTPEGVLEVRNQEVSLYALIT